MTTDKTIKSKYQPKQTNVTWVDLSGETPIEKHFINGRWIAVSEGNAGSSNPTEADATKVWQVTPVQKGTKTEEFVIAPKQILNIDIQDPNTTIFQNVSNLDKFAIGNQATVIVDGVEYTGEITDSENDPSYPIFVIDIGQSKLVGKLPAESSQTGNEELFCIMGFEPIEVEISVSAIGEVPIYDYNWAPGVKIPIPTAEDEGKILVVTKVEGDNTSTIVPEQLIPAEYETALTDVDMTKFVVGNTVKVTMTYEENDDEVIGGGTRGAKSANSQTFIATGVIEEGLEETALVTFSIDSHHFDVFQVDNLLYTSAGDIFAINSTIKLEYIESNYEYQLQENSGGSSNILYCEGSDDGKGLITAYIDSSELGNPQITTISVDTGEEIYYFYRMYGNRWLVSEFATFSDSNDWVKAWNTKDQQYPTIEAYFTNK